MKNKSSSWLFWIGIILLVADLLTYYEDILNYFTTLGIVLLVISILLIIAGWISVKK